MPELGIIFRSKILLNQSESEILSCKAPKYQRIEFSKLKLPALGLSCLTSSENKNHAKKMRLGTINEIASFIVNLYSLINLLFLSK